MLQTAEFPFPGSQAIFRGKPVRIPQWDRATGLALVFGERETHNATRDELSPLPELPPFDAWCADRIRSAGGGVVTPATLVFESYQSFVAERGFRIPPTSRLAFYWQMRRAGYERTWAYVPDGHGHHQSRLCWRIVLAGAPGVVN